MRERVAGRTINKPMSEDSDLKPRTTRTASPLTGRERRCAQSLVESGVRESPDAAWDFSRIPVFSPNGLDATAHDRSAVLPSSVFVQPKLQVGAVDDPLEREADNVADQVMRMPHPEASTTSVEASTTSVEPKINRKCEAFEKEDEEPRQMQMPTATPRYQSGAHSDIVHDVLQSPGQPLDAATRAYFEPRFGHDFSMVRVHTDDRAAASADSMGASAYTTGSNIAFATGRYDTATTPGRRLLAHELTHVVQQRVHQSGASSPSLIQRDADSDDYKQGYQDGLSGGESHAVPRDGDALTDYNEGYAKGHNEFAQQASGNASGPADAPTSAPAVAPGQSGPDSDDYKQGYQDGLSGGESQAVPRAGDALADYTEGYAKGQFEFSQQSSSGSVPASNANSGPASAAAAPGQSGPDSDDYKQGYQDGLSGGEPHAVPRDGDSLTDYDDGYAKGQYEFSQQSSSGGASASTASSGPVPATPAPGQSGPDSDDYKQGYQDGLNGGQSQAGARDGDALTDYNEGYAKGHYDSQQSSAPVPEPVQTGPGKGPVKTATGVAVIEALQLIPSQQPITVPGGVMGDVTLTPGANINGKILVAAAPLYVYYIDGVDLYEAYTPDFIRDIWLTAFSQGAARATWLIPLIKAEFAFIEAFLAPVWVVVVVDLVEWLAFYDEHKQQIHEAVANFGPFNDARLELKSRFPTLYNKAFMAALDQLWLNLGEGVQASDVAYFVGRVIGTRGLLGKFEDGTEITLKVIAKVVAEYASLVTLLHAPGIITGAGKAAAAGAGKTLQAKLADSGINVSEEDAIKIAKELAVDSGAMDFLNQVTFKAQSLQKSLSSLGALSQP